MQKNKSTEVENLAKFGNYSLLIPSYEAEILAARKHLT